MQRGGSGGTGVKHHREGSASNVSRLFSPSEGGATLADRKRDALSLKLVF